MSEARREYVEALAAYEAAQKRLIEAKRHYDPKTAPEAIEQRKAKQAEYRDRLRAARNTPEALAERRRRKEEHERWMQELANLAQASIERRENMPDVLRIITRVGPRP